MDNIDIKLLHILAESADATTSSLVPKLNLSVPAINKRIAKLKTDGIIEQTTVLINPQKVGKQITAFILVVLEHFKQSEQLFRIVESDPDILECYEIGRAHV